MYFIPHIWFRTVLSIIYKDKIDWVRVFIRSITAINHTERINKFYVTSIQHSAFCLFFFFFILVSNMPITDVVSTLFIGFNLQAHTTRQTYAFSFTNKVPSDTASVFVNHFRDAVFSHVQSESNNIKRNISLWNISRSLLTKKKKVEWHNPQLGLCCALNS